jgi:hypothetical protein
MNNNILALFFLMAGTLLTTAVTTMGVPAAYAGNENEAEDESQAALTDCDENEVERAGFDCVAIAEADIESDGGGESRVVLLCHVSASGEEQQMSFVLPQQQSAFDAHEDHDGPLGEQAGPDYLGECDGRSNV